jgi:predicted nucleic acid-binding Zn ribbon protein
MGWMLTVLAAAFLGKTLAKAAVRRRPVFTYKCKNCGEYITVMDMGLLTAACPGCDQVAGRVYDETATDIHARGQKRVEQKVQAVAAIAAGAIAGFLYGFVIF